MKIKPSPQDQDRGFALVNKKDGKASGLAIDCQRIFIFVAITYGLSFGLYLVNFSGRGLFGNHLTLGSVRTAVMFAPLTAHIATRLITREGWSNTFLQANFRGGRWRYYLAAWLLPLLAAIVGGGIYYLLFPSHFDPTMTDFQELGATSISYAMQPLAFFLAQVGLALLTPLSEALLFSFGEEFGWRAYLLPKLIPFGPTKAVLLVGIIHGAWHWPSIFLGSDYGFGYWGAPVLGPLLFALVSIFSSGFYAWVTLRSGSVWPAALGHGAINASNRLVWIFFRGVPNPLMGPGLQGMIGSLGYAVLALLIILNPRALTPPGSAIKRQIFSKGE